MAVYVDGIKDVVYKRGKRLKNNVYHVPYQGS